MTRVFVTMLAVVALWLAGASVAYAQAVRWNAPGTLMRGQIQKIELIFEDCAPEGEVELPEIETLEVLGEPTESRVFSMVNFETRTTVTLGFPVRTQTPGSLALPSFEVETSEGRFLVPASTAHVNGPTVPGAHGRRAEALENVAAADLRLGTLTPFAGEVVDVIFDIGVDERRSASLAGSIDWDPDPMLVEVWSEPKQVRPQPGRNGVRFDTRGLFPEPGVFELEAAGQAVNIETQQGRGGGLFRSRRVRTVTVVDTPGAVTVRPLPTPAPAGFEGAVGRFALTSSVAPERARVGEPLTWTLTLRGEGNWTAGLGLPQRAVPNDIEVIRPKTVRRFDEGSLFEGQITEDLVLIPTRPGQLLLEPVHIVYFDPGTGRYVRAEVAPPPIEIEAAGAASRVPAVPSTPGSAGAGRETIAEAPDPSGPRAPDVAVLPGMREDPRLPRDPAEGASVSGGIMAAPLGLRAWLIGLLLTAIPGLGWAAWLGRRRAVRLDPLAGRRAARAALLRSLSDAAAPRPDELLAWQRHAAELFGVDTHAPTASRLEAARWGEGATEVSGVDADAWRRLWREADAFLHSTSHVWPADWAARANAAVAATQVRGVPLLAGFAGRHLWPALTIVWLVCLPGAPSADMERPGLEAYARGDFAQAAEAMQARVRVAPLDWKARSDLGLAQLQQGAVDAALAESVAAFVLQPRDEALRWNLAVTSRRAGWIDPAVRDLAWGGGVHALARQLPVGRWQAASWGFGVLAWLALAAAVAIRQQARPTRAAFVVAATSTIAVAVCAGMVGAWGSLGEPGAALVSAPTSIRSLPTELVEDQVEVVLEAGRVVVVERSFLGWLQVRLANDDVGWVRTGSISPVYRAMERPINAP